MCDTCRHILYLVARLRRYAVALLDDPDKADQLVADCLAESLHRMEEWRAAGMPKAWLFHRLHRVYTANARRYSAQRNLRSDAGTIEAADRGRHASNEGNRYVAALYALPDNLRIVLLLVDLEDMTYGEAAAVIGEPLSAVKSLLHRAREGLRHSLAALAEMSPR